jgi:hypothetical protein
MLVQSGLHELASSVPASWGSIDHREKALAGLERRSSDLGEYIEAIAQFASGLA